MRRIDPPLLRDPGANARAPGAAALPGKPLLLAGAGLFAAGMIASAALAPRVLAPSPVAVARGDILAGFAPEAILSLSYTTPSGMTTLQRSARGARFQIQPPLPTSARCSSAARRPISAVI